MRAILIVSLCLAAGCASQPRAAKVRPPAIPGGQPVAVDLHPDVVTVETRYEVRGYYDGADPSIWHASHPVYRATEVSRAGAALPPAGEGGPLTTYVPITYDPLPASAELDAQLAAQKEITADLRAVRAKMVALQDQAETQYQQLLAGREASDHLRANLEQRIAQNTTSTGAKADATPTGDRNGNSAPNW